jgi:acyl-coenzyme A thioesterase PaaI-like protein
VQLLAPHAHPGPYAQSGLDDDGSGFPSRERLQRPGEIFPYSPVLGPLNPLAPPVRCEVAADGAVRGSAEFGACYAGAPGAPRGLLHGGVIALVMDELLGFANIASGTGGMTGTLTVRYRSPTPVGRPLHMEAHTERVDGRKIHARGSIRHGDRLTAEAEGVFIRVTRVPGV